MKRTLGIIFDCDGTLAKSLDLGMGSYNYAFEKLGERFREPEEIKKYFGSAADRIFFQLLGDEVKALEAFEHYFDHESRQVEKVHLHQGIPELLEKLRAAEMPLGIVTGRHERDLGLILEHHALPKYFKSIVCDNHLPNSKPAPDGILLAASQLGLPLDQTIYIGDSTMDIRAAHAAGAMSIAALWDSWAKPRDMLKENPTFVAHTPLEVWEILQTLG